MIYLHRIFLALSAIGIGVTVPFSVASPSMEDGPGGMLLALSAGFFFFAAISFSSEEEIP